jgi:hypothetical protein
MGRARRAGFRGSAPMKGREAMSKVPQPGLDGRHRDLDGQASRKHGNTLVGTLREAYGDDFAPGARADMRLSTLLQRTGAQSLSQYLKKPR